MGCFRAIPETEWRPGGLSRQELVERREMRACRVAGVAFRVAFPAGHPAPSRAPALFGVPCPVACFCQQIGIHREFFG